MRWVQRTAIFGLVSGFLLLGGCCFLRDCALVEPALVIGPLVGALGEAVEIPVEVVGFPEPGVAGLAVLDLRYDPAVLQVSTITGVNGFVVLCSCINNVAGQAKFILVNPAAGATTGAVAMLRGTRAGLGDPRFTLSSENLQLVDSANRQLAGYAIRLGGAPSYTVRRS